MTQLTRPLDPEIDMLTEAETAAIESRTEERRIAITAALDELKSAVKSDKIVARLTALLSELEYSRETHVQWANASAESLARNPNIGDRTFHLKCVEEYDERLAAINEAIEFLSGGYKVLGFE